MPKETDMIKEHHKSITRQLTEGVNAADAITPENYSGRQADLDGFVKFLTDDLIPHAQGEERSMYPAVAELVCRYGNPLSTMSLDHQAIVERIERLKDIAGKLKTASPDERIRLVPTARRIAVELGALISVHLAKEEIALLPLMEEHMEGRDLAIMLHGMHEE
jgi:iron-sulfur cluster repair protein YtfE (RIC family)